jgi:dipeptidyl aminopeptidase/acylaminoacyl peptidase
LALLLGLLGDEKTIEADAPYRDQSSLVQAVVSDSGPLDLLYQHQHARLRTVVEEFMGRPPDGPADAPYKLASPSSHVSAKAPPLMLIYGEADGQVPVETADEFVVALDRARLKEVSYHRLGGVDHCPHSLIRVSWLVPAVNEFFQRTLARR